MRILLDVVYDGLDRTRAEAELTPEPRAELGGRK
jgi:hypothetical protein